MDWFELPELLIHVYASQIEVLQAGEALTQSSVLATGNALTDRYQRRETIMEWQKVAGRYRGERKAQRPANMGELAAGMEGTGIAIRAMPTQEEIEAMLGSAA